MKLSDFDFDLPERLIATRPARPRSSARLLLAQGMAIEDRIVNQLPEILRPGDRLPPTRDLARQLGVNRNTVVAAYESLSAEGWTRSHTGKGTFLVSREGAGAGGLDLTRFAPTGFDDAVPYTIGVVDLPEGGRLLCWFSESIPDDEIEIAVAVCVPPAASELSTHART